MTGKTKRVKREDSLKKISHDHKGSTSTITSEKINDMLQVQQFNQQFLIFLGEY